jgi:methanogenic corrinoid protein MtbC1
LASFELPEARQLFELSTHGDRDGACRFARGLLAYGAERGLLIDEVVVPVLHAIGDASESGALDAVTEHDATTVIEDVLTVLAPSEVRPRHEGSVLVGSPPGEWHVLTARIVADLLRDDGWRTAWFGLATSTDDVLAATTAQRPFAVLLSCTMPEAVFATATVIERLHDARIPTVVGGAAFGTDPRRAFAIGADAWAASAADAAAVLATWERRPPRVDDGGDHRPNAVAPTWEPTTKAAVVDSALRVLERAPSPIGDTIRRRTSAADLARIVDVAEVAVLTADDRVLCDDLTWWRRYLAGRSATPAVAGAVLEALAGAAPPGPVRGALLRALGDHRNTTTAAASS